MKIKVYNKTCYDSKPFKKVLEVAHHRLGIKGCVIVKLTRGGTWLSKGYAHKGFPYMWHLSNKLLKGEDRFKMEKDSGYGWVEMSLPREIGRGGKMEIDHATWIYELLFHELGHVYDYRNGNRWAADDTPKKSGRRVRWRERPSEIRAENFAYDAERKVAKKQKEELILVMALEIERVCAAKLKRKKEIDKIFASGTMGVKDGTDRI